MTLLHEYIQTDTLPSGEAGLGWFSGLVVYATDENFINAILS